MTQDKQGLPVPAPGTGQTTPQAPDRSRVVVATCPSYAATDVERALAETFAAIGGLEAFVKAGQTVLIKPNLFSPHAPEDAVTTHPEVVRQVVLACARAGAGRIWVGDSPVGTHAESELWLKTGMTEAVTGTPAELKSWRVKQMPINCDGDVLAVPEWFAEVDVVISLAKLKAHCLTTLTGALKNMYGMVSGLAKTQFHVKYPSPLAMSAFLVRMFGALKPHLTIMDAVIAMEGNGPAHGRPLPVGVLLASRDAVALDAVACRALRISPESVPMIRMAAGSNLGCMEESNIDCVGSGVPRLRDARMKPSLAQWLKHVPEWSYALTPLLFRMRPWIQRKLCIKCGMCVTTCPQKAIRQPARDNYPAVNQSDCIGCFCCLESCPQGAFAVRVYLGGLICIAQQKRRKIAR
jgi:uncharacterized protein (DUF362 family)/Pyruvate/2-oxoacid:ferredoxin oxidoreductase delta subunit